MKHTQEQLEAMSDFELNKLAADIYLPCEYIFNEEKEVVELAMWEDIMDDGFHDEVLKPCGEYNPCNKMGWCLMLMSELCSGESLLCAAENKRKIVIVYILAKQS